MKKAFLFSTIFCALFSACNDDKGTPAPQTPQVSQLPTAKLEGRWKLDQAQIISTDGNQVMWANDSFIFDFVPGSSVLNYYEYGKLRKTGTYSLSSKTLTISMDSVFQPNQSFTLDSLSLNKVVLRDTILYPTNNYYYFTYRLKR